MDPEELTFDSIFLYSSTDTVKVPDNSAPGESGQFVLTNDSLNINFIINPLGDSITVVSYSLDDKSFEDVLIFGDLQGASINAPTSGQSISRYGSAYVKDKSQSIGEPNDTTGMCGTIKGIIYNKDSKPVQNKTFTFDFNFETSENGAFSARVLSKPSTYNRIRYKTGPNSTRSVSIDEIFYVMEPDDVVELDIYLLDVLTGINDPALENAPINIYPNPVSVNEQLKVRIELPVTTSNIWVEIEDLNGKLIRKEKVSRTESFIETPSRSGLYIISVLLDSKIISSERIVVND
jgi:hypothetical protein